jgi:hypothetical protein
MDKRIVIKTLSVIKIIPACAIAQAYNILHQRRSFVNREIQQFLT